MDSKRSLDEIREAMNVLDHDVDSLYRYNDPIESIKLFDKMTIRDKRRLLYWALKEEDADICSVAGYLMGKLDLTPNDIGGLSSQMPKEDVLEIKEVLKQIHGIDSKQKKVPTEYEQEQIIKVLSDACKKIGFLIVEKAYWVLIPHDVGGEPKWIECSNKNIIERSPFQVFYTPDKQERVKLLELMRESSWIINVHNHPSLAFESENLEFSLEDRQFAKYWESLRPELANKMVWGVVQKNYVHGMPFSLPPHMTVKYPNKQNFSNEILETKQEVSIIDAHALYENMTQEEKKRGRERVKAVNKNRDRVYNQLTYASDRVLSEKEHNRHILIMSIIALIISTFALVLFVFFVFLMIKK